MQNLKMVCHNLNWSFNTCMLTERLEKTKWQGEWDSEGVRHNAPLGNLCTAEPPILKPAFLSSAAG